MFRYYRISSNNTPGVLAFQTPRKGGIIREGVLLEGGINFSMSKFFLLLHEKGAFLGQIWSKTY